jgi:hypothetical protein
MLLVIRTLIIAYYKWYGFLRENEKITREAAIKKIGEHFRSGSSEWGHNQAKLVFEKEQITFFDLLRQFRVLLKYDAQAKEKVRMLGISNELVKELMPESSIDLPFLFIFDEASIFDRYYSLPSRLSGLHVLRRALHLLNVKTPLFFLIVGTNSDAIDFSPALSFDSIRFQKRKNLLPAFWLTRNTGIFSKKLKLHDIEVSTAFLLNRNVMKLFFSMGRPLWSSVDIENALNLAITKISNGNKSSMESLISLLLCRADLNVVPSSVLCRNLVKSHMAVVYNISTDSRNMKIGYPSEPALALAARNILQDKKSRKAAFSALFEFLQRRAIDKGRISETIIEHFLLFAIDDVAQDQEYLKEFVENFYLLSEVSGFGNKNIDKILSCRSILLGIDWENIDEKSKIVLETEPENITEIRGVVAHEDYHIINVKHLLKSLLTESIYSKIGVYLPDHEPLMNGLVNASHLVNLEGDSTKILSDLSGTNPRPFKVDRSLLKMGLIRGCGFALPPGTFGLDFIIPVLLNTKVDSNHRPRYSFIGIQVKTVAEHFYKEVAKTSLAFIIERCLNHMECVNGNHHSGCMSDEEYEDIVANQMTLIMCVDRDNVTNKVKGCFYSAKPQVNSTFKRVHADEKMQKEEEESSPSEHEDTLECDEDVGNEGSKEIAKLLKFSYLNTHHLPRTELELKLIKEQKLQMERLKKVTYAEEVASKLWPKSMKDFKEESPIFFNYPSYSKMERNYKPDLLIKNVINETLSIQNLIWDRGESRQSHKLTCIISNDLKNFEHLVDERTIDICKKIVVYINHIFNDVDEFNLPAVIDSALFLEFSKFYQFNPELRLARGEVPISNDKFTSMSHFTKSELQNSINAAMARRNA